MESEKKEWKQENEKLTKKVEELEDEAITKNAKLLELGNLFLIPQFETKSIYSILIYSYTILYILLHYIYLTICIIISGKEFKSLRPLIQIDNSDNYKNVEENKETKHKENDILKKKVKELYRETVHLKKNNKHTKCQVKKIVFMKVRFPRRG